MAVESVFGARTVWHAETDPAASKVLAARWPGVPNHGDITTMGSHPKVSWEYLEPADILTGGFPCQPFSHAGRRKGANDERHLWPHVREAIRRIRPRYTILENVAGLRSLGFDRVLGDLAEDGMHVWWTSLRAGDIGAPHGRERLFILANPASDARRLINGDSGTATNSEHPRSRREADNARWGKSDAAGRDLRIQPERHRTAAADSARDGWDEGRPESAGFVGGSSDAAISSAGHVELLPTPTSRDHKGRNQRDDDTCLIGALLPTPQAHDGMGGAKSPDAVAKQRLKGGVSNLNETAANESDWGKYEPAIRRWETLTRPAPAPTEPNRNNKPRLNPAFSEWMMGWPQGWVTDIAISRNDQLRIIGNGVVPQCAAAALRYLLTVSEVAA